MAEFQFLHAEAPVAQTRNAFKCPVASACPEQALRPTAPNETSAASTLNAQPCRNGTTGILCASCEPGWRKAPSGRCTQCASSASDGIGFKQLSSGLFLISVGTVVAYVALRKLLTFKRQKRQKSLGAAQSLFAELDSDGSGEITRDEMRANLALLQGMELDEDTAARLIEAIDIDHSGDIDEIEFVAWMEHSTSQLKTSMIVAKIVLGLGQIMSKQPETLKEEFPGPQWDSDWLQVFSFKFDWVLPVCEVDYVQRFFLNTVVLPTFLLSLVAVTWAMNRKPDDEANEAREDFDETKASKRSDYYFAFFLSYPTITQTFFGHFNCRHLSDELSVMEKDCELQERHLPSAFGLRLHACRCDDRQRPLLGHAVVVACSVFRGRDPLHKHWLPGWDGVVDEPLLGEAHAKGAARREVESRGPARFPAEVRLHVGRLQGGGVLRRVGGSDPQADDVRVAELDTTWHRLPVVLLCPTLHHIHGEPSPRVATQHYADVLCLRRQVIHIKMWPYPSLGSNLLKMYVDVELFLVTLVGLILRINDMDLSNDPLPLGLQSIFPDGCGWLCTGTLYGDLLWVLLVLTLLPIVFTLVYRSPEEKAQTFLHKIARIDTADVSEESSVLAKRRRALQQRASEARRWLQSSVPRPRLGRGAQQDAAAARPQSRRGAAISGSADLFRRLSAGNGSASFAAFAGWWQSREAELEVQPDEESLALARRLFGEHGGTVNHVQLRRVLVALMRSEWEDGGVDDRGRKYYGNKR